MSHIDSTISHLEFRPLVAYNDHGTVTSFMNSEYWGVYTARVGRPAEQELFDSVEDALDYMFDDDFGEVPMWYYGGDFVAELQSRDELFVVLLAHLRQTKYLRKLCKILDMDEDVAKTIFQAARPEIAVEIFGSPSRHQDEVATAALSAGC